MVMMEKVEKVYSNALGREAYPVYCWDKGVVVYPQDKHYHFAMSIYKMAKNRTMEVAQGLLALDESVLENKYNELMDKKNENRKPKIRVSEDEIREKARELCEGDMLFEDLKYRIVKAKEVNDADALAKLKAESDEFFAKKFKEAEKLLKKAA